MIICSRCIFFPVLNELWEERVQEGPERRRSELPGLYFCCSYLRLGVVEADNRY